MRSVPEDRPDPQAGELEQLDPRAIPYDTLARWVRVGVECLVLGLLALTAYADGWFTPTARLVLVLLGVLGICIEIVCAFLMPRLHHKFTRFRVDAHGLEIRSGVLWRSVVTVARSRIQHLDVTQGPIERNYELGRLHVHTAGTHDATIQLHGITHERAKALRDELGVWTADADGV